VRVLVVNAGSSSLKLSLLDDDDTVVAEEELRAGGGSPGGGDMPAEGPAGGSGSDTSGGWGADLKELGQALRGPLAGAQAVGHRIVHGGETFAGPVRVQGEVREALQALVDLAPLHQPRSLAALDAVSELLPDVPAVACFDTTFHAQMPAAAATYALPARWRERWRLRRYGFHGLSHAWVARRAPQLLGVPSDGLRVVSAHLGAGASLCAIAGGRSLDTTMGFTPLEGLVMATRSGSVDPGMLLWLIEHERLAPHELAEALEHESGLLGLSGTADMVELTRRALAGEARAELALAVYVHRLRAGVAAMAAAMGGVDVLAFTGGVGEGSAEVRKRTARGLAFLGVSIAEEANGSGEGDRDLSGPGAAVRTAVLRAREDLEIAAQTRATLATVS
jgi:acetate kinase